MLSIHFVEVFFFKRSSIWWDYQHKFCYNNLPKTLLAEGDRLNPLTAASFWLKFFVFSANFWSSCLLVDDYEYNVYSLIVHSSTVDNDCSIKHALFKLSKIKAVFTLHHCLFVCVSVTAIRDWQLHRRLAHSGLVSNSISDRHRAGRLCYSSAARRRVLLCLADGMFSGTVKQLGVLRQTRFGVCSSSCIIVILLAYVTSKNKQKAT